MDIKEKSSKVKEEKSSSELSLIPSTPKFTVSKMFISAGDLAAVIDILIRADNITAEEAARRLSVMCNKGSLLIVPVLGKAKK